ncbi:MULTISPECIES: mechanosensitive ion channel domain-containing protein [unclassified Methylobacterium]|uniref:mechanosensitive ion channel family protein n=1 Tax=unclassified Methylobacterium TaxID=2615210 RepID=UPI0011C1E043|nr:MULTISPECIES: mechanosensitive ion channel domain-containing protein [unclassified Methylobacterium]MCJ2118429.1 mechanosensitive ion channel family protein [Methylobacterium sp. J-001]QEE41600.1 mechanosensitive ion channel [Methylobacterium sp. WL1]TXN57236.1 mechanosensitive ion channel [Methylobacterium sp. WL2]
MHFLGIDWVGVNAENGRKLVLSLVFIAVVVGGGMGLRALVGLVLTRTDHSTLQTKFWTRQGISLLAAVLLVLGLLSIWFNDPARLATAFGLLSAGLAFALQQVITSLAGYFVILRGSTFTVGDRITMGGVRGDVLRLGFIQTTIMEMGQPPAVQGSSPAMWVRSRQFTGRIVTVSNAQIFSEPVFNYTRDFPFIWEEMAIPITYESDRLKVEAIMLAAARRHALDATAMAGEAKARLQDRFGVKPVDLEPRVFFRITDNWLELTVRFILGTHQIRGAKDAMSREILAGLDDAGIGIASATYDIVGLPPVELAGRRRMGRAAASSETAE